VVDSQSIETTVESALSSKADMIEIMPGTLSKVIKKLKTRLPMPIVAGGIIETKQEIEEVLKSGAHAVSTGKKTLWEL
jgi:glycerol uptake operon antiterminator